MVNINPRLTQIYLDLIKKPVDFDLDCAAHASVFSDKLRQASYYLIGRSGVYEQALRLRL